ncbi:hypothetical protein ACF1G0_01095 [Streptomyces sp. NPDC013953]|uniref:hypothetical protein n=1 Tax=Streptomyces sp. NPDC013953 TaxID=3364868 RepID=UPI0036F79954
MTDGSGKAGSSGGGAARNAKGLALWMPAGLAIGISVGQLTDRPALGLALGLCFGVTVGCGVEAALKKRQEGAGSPDA